MRTRIIIITRKAVSLLSIAALLTSMLILTTSKVYAAAPTGTLTGTAITVNIGEIKPINTLTVTAPATSDITDTGDIYIRIPAGVNAYWDISDTTPTFGDGETAESKVASAVTYPDPKTLKIDVTTTFAGSDTLTIADLSYIGYGSATTGAALEWSVDGGTTYGAANSNTAITVADGTQDTLTGVAVALSNDVVSSTNVSYTVNFTVPTGGVIPKNGKIKITFPAGFTVTGAGAGTLTGIDGTVSAAVSGQDVTLTRQNDGTNSLAGAKTVVITGITNHATADSTYTVTVTTQTSAADLLATAASSAFSVNPAAISNLTCEPSGQGGAVWLRWTTPLGTSNGYEVKYQQGSSITYSSATAFTQTWASGTVGTAQQQLLTGLNPNTQYTFAMKAKGANSSISAISTLTPSCYAPGAASRIADTTAPVSRITTPALNANVLAGQALVIKGTALDSGGSSVQKVEVSVDNGTTWMPAEAIDNIDGNLVWKFTWDSPAVGSHTIKTRAYDWAGNIETPGSGIAVNVVTAIPAPAAPAAPALPTAPGVPAMPTLPHPAPTTVSQMQENLVVLQTYLLSLLQQLLTVLTAELQSLSR